MPQLMCDTNNDSPEALRRTATFILEMAQLAEDESTPQPVQVFKPFERAQAPTLDTAKVGFGKPTLVPAGLDASTGSTAAIPQQAAPVAQLVVPAPGPIEFDVTGLPWDARVHQETRGKKVDGTWKVKKGLDPTIAAAVIAELRSGAAAPVGQPAQPAPVTQVAPLPPVTQVAPPPPVDAAPTGQPAPVPPAQITDFRRLMQKITAATNAGKLTNVQVDAALQSVDLPPRQLVSLVQNPDKVAGVELYIDACLASAA